MAIGDKCQSAKTYLERNFETLTNVSRDELIRHAVKAMQASAAETELTEHNVSIGVLGKDEDFKSLSKEEIRTFLDNAGGEQAMQIN